jgi:DEAD/DEAH box helicase domain-containing protein
MNTNTKNIVAFDVETQFTADEVGGWNNIRDMLLSAAVTFNEASGEYRYFTEEHVAELIDTLKAADLVVGYNVMRFDYEVLRHYTDDPLDNLPTLDMLIHLRRALGWRPKLDSVASATLGETKSADGLQAVRWYRQGQLDKVLEYCRRDVEVTWRVYDFGRQYGYVQYRDRLYRPQKVPVNWRSL